MESDVVAMTLRLPAETHERLRRMAFERRMKITELVRQAVDDFLTEQES